MNPNSAVLEGDLTLLQVRFKLSYDFRHRPHCRRMHPLSVIDTGLDRADDRIHQGLWGLEFGQFFSYQFFSLQAFFLAFYISLNQQTI